MKFECKDLERCLEVPELMADAREHARNCPACRRELWVWSEMSNLAAGLREEWDTPDLWPKIRTQLAAQPKRKPVRRYDWRLLGAIAAVLLVAASGLTWYKLRPAPAGPPPASAEMKGDFLTEQTLKEVEQAEKAYAASIEKLSRIAAPILCLPSASLTPSSSALLSIWLRLWENLSITDCGTPAFDPEVLGS